MITVAMETNRTTEVLLLIYVKKTIICYQKKISYAITEFLTFSNIIIDLCRLEVDMQS